MPKWLQEMFAPTLMLWVSALSYGVALAISPGGLPKRAELAWGLLSGLVITWWVVADAQKRRRPLCYDFDSFVYMAWPFVVPVYVFQTRGWRGFITLLWFAGICVMAGIASGATHFIRTMLQN